MRSRLKRVGLLSVALLWLVPVIASAAFTGTLLRTDKKQVPFVDIRWVSSRNVYSVTVQRGSSRPITLEVKRADVADIIIQAPASLSQLSEAVKRGQQFEIVIPHLKKMITDYRMLSWDVTASRLLADVYIQQGNNEEALSVVKAILDEQPQAYGKPIAIVYWKALLALGRTATLEREIIKSIKYGSREVAARAQNMRGDIAKSKGDYETALKDGYLRTWLMFRDITAIQPEALAKAAECFVELNQPHYAEKMRNELLAKYPQSSYAKKEK